jgi:protein gp37
VSAVTSIEWCDRTWNPTRGCSRVSLGCGGPKREGGCYAEKFAHRFSGPGQPYEGLTRMTANGPRWTGIVRLVPYTVDEPLRWRGPARDLCDLCDGAGSKNDHIGCWRCHGRGVIERPLRIFVNSMSDLFHESLNDEQIARVFAVMLLSPRHTFQILTKRPERMRRFLSDYSSESNIYGRILRHADAIRAARPGARLGEVGIANPAVHPAKWIWLGVSVEDQPTADERIPLLLQTPAAVRFVSYEPALGPVDFRSVRRFADGFAPRERIDALTGHFVTELDGGRRDGSHRYGDGRPPLPALDLTIVGGESGPGARPFSREWARATRDACQAAGVAFFYKQEGSGYRCAHAHGSKGGHIDCFPADLRVREFPR